MRNICCPSYPFVQGWPWDPALQSADSPMEIHQGGSGTVRADPVPHGYKRKEVHCLQSTLNSGRTDQKPIYFFLSPCMAVLHRASGTMPPNLGQTYPLATHTHSLQPEKAPNLV